MLSNGVQTSHLCPSCGSKGRKVGAVTLWALLKPELRDHIGAEPFRFCVSPGCDTVYYAEDGTMTYSRADLIVRVGLKETEAPRLLCYCFGRTAEELESEVQRTGRTTLAEQITASLENGCWCETKNPQGTCCLGVVHQYARAALERFGQPARETARQEEAGCCGCTGAASKDGSCPDLSPREKSA